MSRAQHAKAGELAERMLRMADDANDPSQLVEAHGALGVSKFFQGAFGDARVHQEKALALYDPDRHQAHVFAHGVDPGIRALNFLALTLWLQGYPDQALERMHEALALARKLAYGPTLAFTLAYAAELHQLRRESSLTREYAETVIELSTEQGLPFWLAWGTLFRGWALTECESVQVGITLMRQGLAADEATGSADHRSYFLALLADKLRIAGEVEAGRQMLEQALTVVEQTDEHCYEAELSRLKAILLLATPAADDPTFAAGVAIEAEASLHKAISVARLQGAKSLELRAISSLARLWQRMGKIEPARLALFGIYNWFSEGFDTADLRDARTLVDELS